MTEMKQLQRRLLAGGAVGDQPGHGPFLRGELGHAGGGEAAGVQTAAWRSRSQRST
ncbi:hypothetical protein [Streptomyces hokutonensis]|uniref:hypothetical protein n=1 Tax=Streptomyces hokutonensis TaxID=1306990 RepID=UPI003802B06B